MRKLKVVILKPSKYTKCGQTERFHQGFMPNPTIQYLASMTPKEVAGYEIEVVTVDEYVQTDLKYLEHLHESEDCQTLLALVGVQSHQLQRAIDLTAYALDNGVQHCIIGGPHPITVDTTMLQNKGVSFALSEAELVWLNILKDAIDGCLCPIYGEEGRWQKKLEAPILIPPKKEDLRRYILPMVGSYPARGCPFTCNFCSVIKIAGRRVRSQSIETTMESLRLAKAAGVKMIIFTSDNFNKYEEREELLQAMIDEKLNLPFFVQCDTQIVKQEGLVKQLAEAGCFQIYVGVESLTRKTLLAANKAQNHPENYKEIVHLCAGYGIKVNFSCIIGFPEDTRESILENLEELILIGPDIASFYILTPIPGTDQYDQFMEKGLVTETNLDRFDGTCATWRHPNLSANELEELLFHCYKKFYSAKHFLKNIWKHGLYSHHRFKLRLHWEMIMPLFMRWCAFRKTHPLSGGIGRLKLKSDSVSDFAKLRMERFGFELIPLAQSLKLSASDLALNANVRG